MTRQPDSCYPDRTAFYGCGHPRTEENTQMQASGVPKCKICNRRRAREGVSRLRWQKYLAGFGIVRTSRMIAR